MINDLYIIVEGNQFTSIDTTCSLLLIVVFVKLCSICLLSKRIPRKWTITNLKRKSTINFYGFLYDYYRPIRRGFKNTERSNREIYVKLTKVVQDKGG
jgi:hypothetical protein